LGLGKSTAAIASGENQSVCHAGADHQAGIAGYGAYAVGRAAEIYLSEAALGAARASTVIQEILNQVESNTILYRLRRSWGNS